MQSNANINHSASQIPVSLSAPTLITLLDKKSQPSGSNVDKQQQQQLIVQSAGGSKDQTSSDQAKDDDADLLAGFSEVLVKLDDEDLADLDSIINNPELLVNEDEQSKDEDSMQATPTDDYDQMKIKQLVDDFTTAVEPVIDQKMPTEMEIDVNQPPSDIENSNPASIEVPDHNPTESNDSKPDEPAEEKVVIISDESSNTNDEKPHDDVESQPSAAEDDSKEAPENSDNSGESKDGPPTTVFHVDDSDDDATFEDAKEVLENSGKTAEDRKDSTEESKPETESEKSEKDIKQEKVVDSDDETLGVKARSGRRKATTSRSRDHSNDDNRDATPIRTRSRHSSVIEPKATHNFTKEQDHSMWKDRWDVCVKDLQKHKDYATIVDKRVIPDESSKSYILRPMDMKMIAKNIEHHYLTTAEDVKRDFALMCTNIIMFPNREKVFIDKVQQFLKDAMDVIDSNLEVDEAYKSYRKQIRKKH